MTDSDAAEASDAPGAAELERDETPAERADRNWNELLQEVRVTQTCTQILGGFLLAVAFQPRFEELEAQQVAIYLVLVSLAGLTTALALSIVVLHRRHAGKSRKIGIVLTGDRLLSINLALVALLTAGVTGFIFDFVVGHLAGYIAFGAGLLLSAGLWVFTSAARHPRAEAAIRSASQQ